MLRKALPENKTLVIDALIFENGKAYGYQEYLFNLLDYFYEHRDDFSFKRILIACPESQRQFFSKYAAKFEIACFKITNKLWHLVAQNHLERKLKLTKNDCVLFTYNYSSFFKRCAHVLVMHDLLYLRKSYLPNRLMRWQRKLSIPVSLRKADRIIAISEFTKKDILRHYKIEENKITTVYNYFNFQKYTVTESYFKCEKPYFISICSAACHKNTATVLKAFMRFCSCNDEFHIIFVGGLKNLKSEAYHIYDNMREDIKRRIHILSSISNEELGMIYRNARGFVSLTLFEGLGMPIVEAMYFNLPMVLSDLEIFKEIADVDCAVFVQPFDIEATAKAMLDIADRTEMVNTSSLVQERFSQEKTSERYIQILNTF